jgi:hypothetical protein
MRVDDICSLDPRQETTIIVRVGGGFIALANTRQIAKGVSSSSFPN